METLQQLLAQTLLSAAELLPFGYSFGAGMISTVNPCGFAMLPAFLGFYLGTGTTEFAELSLSKRIAKSAFVGFSVSMGFIAFFGLTGIIITTGGVMIAQVIPWVAVGIGVALVVLGLYMALTRRSIYISIFNKTSVYIGNPYKHGIHWFFLFGVAYGAASLSCALPIFIIVVTSSVTAGDFRSSILQFVSYGMGMALVLITLTMSIAMFKHGLIALLRQAFPFMQKTSAILLMAAGLYILYYWLFKEGLISNLL